MPSRLGALRVMSDIESNEKKRKGWCQMRNVLLSLLVLALVCPSFAAVNISAVNNANGTVTLKIDTAAAEVVRGVALKIVATGGAKLADLAPVYVNPAFNTNIDYAFTVESATPGSYAIGAGHPFADAAAAGVAVLDAPTFSVSMGVLDQGGNQAGFTSAGAVDLITIKTGAGNVCVELDTLRGGIVGDGEIVSNLDSASVCVDVTSAVLSECQKFNLTKLINGATDNVLNTSDLLAIVNYINANRVNPSVFAVVATQPAYDARYNFDAVATINVSDVLALVNYINASRVNPAVFARTCPAE